uniref:Uncharacterized protein n=1 Tax=Oryza rufipogon TaxID=4529 RepID=A0A0E0QNE8_ORYRU
MEGVPSLYPQIRHPHTSTHPRFYFQRFTEDTNMEGRREGKDIVGVRAKKKYPDLEEESNSTKVTIVLDLALEKKARQFEVATNFGKTAHGCCSAPTAIATLATDYGDMRVVDKLKNI